MYNNFFTIVDLNYGVFTLFSSLYLISIKNRRKTTIHLILFLLALSLICLVYFLSSLLIDPIWRFHRWVTVSMSLLGTVHAAYFIMTYPKNNWGRFSKYYFLVFYIIDLLLIILFVYKSLVVGKIYRFDGHFWDVHESKLGQIIGLFILINGIFAIISGIVRSVQIKNARIPLLLLTIGFTLIILIPSITNLLNRLFVISRDEHQFIWGLSGIVGSFIMLVTYINYTHERTTMLSKLYAISLNTVLIIIQFISYDIIKKQNKIFDEMQLQKNYRVLTDIRYRPEDLRYIIKYDKNLNFNFIYQTEDNIPADTYKNEVALIFLQYYIQNKMEVPEIIKKYSGFYWNWIQDIEKKIAIDSKNEIFEEVFNNKRKIQILRSKILDLDDVSFQSKYKKEIIDKYSSDPIYKYFINSDYQSKKEVMSKFPTLYKMNEKIFQMDLISQDFWDNTFVSYYVVYNDSIYKIGYSYKSFRYYIADSANSLFYIIVISVVIILLGYPLFFLVSVLNPLKKLIYGLIKVNKGDFTVNLDIKINDELGYVTRSFNQMVNSIREKNEQLKEYASGLEEKVRERTRDLENSLKQIESLKEKQDGDYFLTSLLVRPLNANKIGSNGIVKVDFIMKQFKQFKYKKWESEIGGDFCLAERVELKERNYSFIVNADAMGKSIQGAGGSLVLGAALHSIVERTKYQDEVKQLYPERWLKYTFVELHKVLENLNGSMFVSIIMILIDEENGFMYFINAEHPNIVLYRNNKAEYIKPKRYLSLLGLSTEGFIQISTFQLKPGDILFLGSDGKDDLLIGYEDSQRVINSDDNMFLKIVEESNGNLWNVYQNLKEKGEFIDDVSIISIMYDPPIELINKKRRIYIEDKFLFDKAIKLLNHYLDTQNEEDLIQSSTIFENLMQKYPNNHRFAKYLLKCYYYQRKWSNVIILLEKLFLIFPYDEKLLIQLIKLLYKKKLYQRALEFAELYVLRNLDNKQIIEITIDIYSRLNKDKKTQKYINLLNSIEK